MPKANKDQIKKILDLHDANLSDQEIADKLGWKNKTAARSVARYRKQAQQDTEEKGSESSFLKTLDEFTREERFEYLKKTLKSMPRIKMTFNSLNNDEKEMFQDEYFKIIRSTESLTEAEEQTLFTAILSFVLAMRSLTLKNLEEERYADSLRGVLKKGDAGFTTRVDDRFQKEYEKHMDKYSSLMKDLKLSRAQRLDKVKTERKTLVDLAEELSTKTAQADAATRIEELSKKRDGELKRLIEEGILFGDFTD